jgi:hypothetical protein
MPQNLGSTSFFQTQTASSTDSAVIANAFAYYHFGQLTEPASFATGGGITGYLYRLTNSPKLYGTLNMYSGSSDASPGVTSNFSVVGSSGNTTIGGTLSVAGQITATSGIIGKVYATGGSTVVIDNTTSPAKMIGNLNGNVLATSESTAKVTISNSGSTPGANYGQVGRIFVQSSAPNAAIAQAGDLWFW